MKVYSIQYLQGTPGREFAVHRTAYVAADTCGEAVEKFYAKEGRGWVHSVQAREMGELIDGVAPQGDPPKAAEA